MAGGQIKWRFRVYETDESTVSFDITNSQLTDPPTIPTPRAKPLEGRVESASFQVKVGDFSDFLSSKLADSNNRQQLQGRLVEAQMDKGSGFSKVWTGRWAGASESDGPGEYTVRFSDEHWRGRQAEIFRTQDTTQVYPNQPHGLKNAWGRHPNPRFVGTSFWSGNDVLAHVETVGTNTVILRLGGKAGANYNEGWNPDRVSNEVVDWIRDDQLSEAENADSSSGNFDHLRCAVTESPSDGDYPIINFSKKLPSSAGASGRLLGPLDDEDPTWPTYVRLAWSTNQPAQDSLVRVSFHADGAATSDTLPLHIGGEDGKDPIQLAKDKYDAEGIRYDSDVFSTYDSSTNPDGLIGHPLIPNMWWRITEPKKLGPWLEENVYKPLGLVPYLNDDGEIAPRFATLPLNEDPSTLTTVDASNVATDGHPTWNHHGTKAVTAVKAKYRAARPADHKQSSSFAADLIEVNEEELDPIDHDRVSNVGRRVHTLDYSGLWSKDQTERLHKQFAREILDRYGDGPVDGQFKGLDALDSVSRGDLIKIDLDTFPNATATGGRGGIRLVQVVGKTQTPAGPDFEFLDAGPNDQALSTPSVSISKNTSRSKEAVDVTISSIDSDATRWTLQLKVGSDPWETYDENPAGTTSVTIYNLPSGTTIQARAMVTAPLRIRSDWATAASATLDGFTAPSSPSASVDGRSITLSWTNGEDDAPVMPVVMEGTSGTPADALDSPLPPGTTEFTFSDLSASTQHTVGVYHTDGSTGGSSSQTTTTATTGTANTLAEPRRLVILQGRQTDTPTDLPPESVVVGEGIEVGFQPKEPHAHTLIQIATDSGFTTIVDEVLVPPGGGRLKVKGLDLGTTYHARAAHVREGGFTDSGWTSTASAQATRLVQQAPQEDNFAAGSVRLYEEGGTLKVHIDSDDRDTDRVYHEAVKNPGSNPHPTVDTSDNETARANLPYDDDALDSAGNPISVSIGDNVYITVGFYNDTYGFGSFVRDHLPVGMLGVQVPVGATRWIPIPRRKPAWPDSSGADPHPPPPGSVGTHKLKLDISVGPEVQSLSIHAVGTDDNGAFDYTYELNLDTKGEDLEHFVRVQIDGDIIAEGGGNDPKQWDNTTGHKIEITGFSDVDGSQGSGTPGRTITTTFQKPAEEVGSAMLRIEDPNNEQVEASGDELWFARSMDIGSRDDDQPFLGVAGDVELAGAAGDGTTDDATAINDAWQQALNVGIKAIMLSKASTYGIGSALVPPAGNLTLRGRGKDQTKIKALADSMTMIDLTDISGCQFEGFTLEGDRANRTDVTGLTWVGKESRCEFRDVRFSGIPGTALFLDEVFDARFFGLNFENCGDTGDPTIEIVATQNTSNMLAFYGLQIQNGFSTLLKLGANAMSCRFYQAHIEWFTDNAQAQTHVAVDCGGFRNAFHDFHVAEASEAFKLSGPRNELHACFAGSSGTRGLTVASGANDCKVFGGSFDGWRVEGGTGVELHGVSLSEAANLFFNSPDGRIIGGEAIGVAGDEALTVESAADDAVIKGMRIKGATDEDPVFFGAVNRVIMEGCNIEGQGTIDRYIDASAADQCLFHGNLMHGTTPSIEDINAGTNGTKADNKSV